MKVSLQAVLKQEDNRQDFILKNIMRILIKKLNNTPILADNQLEKSAQNGGAFMRINTNYNVQSVLKAYGNSAPAKVEKKPMTGMEPDKIEISKEAKEVQLAMQAIKQLPDIREEKVAAIKKQIQEGTYKPSSDEIVEKMFEAIK